ncbi:hypothetical protein [Rathayibacter tritici]|uniref:hypothetical protein n=1 Tax=Rathayibacter tritici TaxID=33888 RepID=UPI0011B01F05|nr:hypothetical protein [Rathayibacter tritici]
MNRDYQQWTVRTGVVIAATALVISAACPASAMTLLSKDPASQSSGQASTARALSRDQMTRLAEELKSGSSSRSVTSVAEGSRVAFHFRGGDSSEQAAGAGAAAGGLAAAICAALGPESGGVGCVVAGGIGVTIASIAAAHGVCPDGQDFRIYLLTLEDQCRE